jgi:hypothetical protein
MAPKKKPLPLSVSQRLIAEERVNVAKRTKQRIAQLLSNSDENIGQENKATQTDIPMHEVLVTIDDSHCCLTKRCFCILLLCMALLYFQGLYLQTHFKTI